jgi:hypothetical protein
MTKHWGNIDSRQEHCFEILHTQRSESVIATVRNDGAMVLSITRHVDTSAFYYNSLIVDCELGIHRRTIGANGVTHHE